MPLSFLYSLQIILNQMELPIFCQLKIDPNFKNDMKYISSCAI